jgi:hypothetical protein
MYLVACDMKHFLKPRHKESTQDEIIRFKKDSLKMIFHIYFCISPTYQYVVRTNTTVLELLKEFDSMFLVVDKIQANKLKQLLINFKIDTSKTLSEQVIRYDEIFERAKNYGVVISKKKKRDYFINILLSHYQSLISDFIFVNNSNYEAFTYKRVKEMVKTKWDRIVG